MDAIVSAKKPQDQQQSSNSQIMRGDSSASASQVPMQSKFSLASRRFPSVFTTAIWTGIILASFLHLLLSHPRGTPPCPAVE